MAEGGSYRIEKEGNAPVLVERTDDTPPLLRDVTASEQTPTPKKQKTEV